MLLKSAGRDVSRNQYTVHDTKTRSLKKAGKQPKSDVYKGSEPRSVRQARGR